jgi:hypothetical protein
VWSEQDFIQKVNDRSGSFCFLATTNEHASKFKYAGELCLRQERTRAKQNVSRHEIKKGGNGLWLVLKEALAPEGALAKG